MACFIQVLSISVVIGSLCGDALGQNKAEVKSIDNAEQFALLCRIYNVAKNPPIHHVDLQDPFKIVNEINALNASFIDEKALNEAEQEGNSSDPLVKPATTREAAVAQALIRRITQKAHIILEGIGRVNATRDIENVKALFAQVIFGERVNVTDLCNGALNGVNDRATACGSKGLSSKGDSAGKNLVVDFFCLCAQRPDRSQEGIDNVCGVYVGSGNKKGNHGWSDTCPPTSSTMWASIKNECGKYLHQHPMSTKEGYEVVWDFSRHLKSGGLYRWGTNEKESSRKAGMLGTGVGKDHGTDGNGLICDGKKGGSKGPQAGGICVYYGPDHWDDNIPWLKKIKTALNSTDTLNNQTATIQRGIEKLQMLLHRAEQIYETTKVISEFHNPAISTNPQTAGKRLTAYNAAWRYHPHAHFILLFVLL